ncbi:hypothetical protein TSOC_008755 [Tetrabaena socialis]|uniref:Uncharacterized protein n=1 Tax=Tetrabaena socialis TaxID=47790 RepID=A0A2J7ZXN5_9CHLO|nr:hypothetical protein TSOC_008755 [Tetrabaena socialis]|eukprot:PNH05033.1 hypothetical protein TSOC_008755 [Tetrabaena socialis]
MVHVPFFNIDLPEPRLGALIPDTISLGVHCVSKALNHGALLLLPPPTDAEVEAFQQEEEDEIPREFDRVRKRFDEGRIVNSDQLSSELEDASFDWYRRQLRTSVLGATDEDMEDVAARKLGLTPPLQEELEERCLAEAVAAMGGEVDAEGLQLAVEEDLAARERAAEQRRLLAARTVRLGELRRQVQPPHRLALDSLGTASGGLLLGVLLFKSASLAVRKLFRPKKKQQRPVTPQERRPSSAQSQAAPATPARPQAGAAAHAAPAGTARQAGAAAQAQPAGQGSSKAAAAAAAATTAATAAASSARKTRPPAKKR